MRINTFKNYIKNIFYTTIISIILCAITYFLYISQSVQEQSPLFSREKTGNRAFYEFLQERKQNIIPVYSPIFDWGKKILTELELNKEQTQKKNYVYIYNEKNSQYSWTESEKIWLQKWIQAGQHIVIFVENPLPYWEALSLPINIPDNERIKLSKKIFPNGLDLSLELITKDFLYENLFSSEQFTITQNNKQVISTHSCNLQNNTNTQIKTIELATADVSYNTSINKIIKMIGWQLKNVCINNDKIYLSTWQLNEASITFATPTEIFTNEYIALQDNITFIKAALQMPDTNDSLYTYIWDEYRNGVTINNSLMYYLLNTIYGRILLFFFISLVLYLWLQNKKIRLYDIPNKQYQISNNTLIQFQILAKQFNKHKVIMATFDIFKLYQKKIKTTIIENDTNITKKEILNELKRKIL